MENVYNDKAIIIKPATAQIRSRTGSYSKKYDYDLLNRGHYQFQ